MKFLDLIREKFVSKFPYSLLSDVILYRNDKDVADLFANEIDYLFHYINNDRHHLIIIEVKSRNDMYGKTPNDPPSEGSPWKLSYNSKEKDIKKQVQDQAEALRQFCENISEFEFIVEGWIIDKAFNRPPIIVDTQYPMSHLKLLTFKGFEKLLDQIRDVVRVEHSDFLREIRRGIISPDICHPEIPNAIKFIDTCRKSLDDRIYEFFKPSINYHAINGCAGMGKSVLLAYIIYVFASDYRIIHKNGRKELINFEEKAEKVGLPVYGERKIFAYAVKKKQIEILEFYWDKIKNSIALVDPNFQPHLRPPVFKQWEGEIPDDCNVLVIDESHDLPYEHQKLVANWINNHNESTPRYLLVACDRNQALKRDESDKNIISGVNFSLHSTRLNRIYRCPFPVYVASIGLMFRWFAPKGAKVILSNEKLREHFGFKPKIDEENDGMVLKMRSDCHPGNNWNQTVSYFKNCSMALKHLSQFSFQKKDVLWVSFQKLDSDFDYNDIGFTWVDLRNDPENEIDKYIKGQEYYVVVIEGLPINMNPEDLSTKEDWGGEPSKTEIEMWKCRRNIYVVCSRASAFLYFIEDTDSTSSKSNVQELMNLLDQVSCPLREKHEPGQTWKFKIISPKTKRKPLVFKDIDDAEDAEDAKGTEDVNLEALIEHEFPIVEYTGEFLTVVELSSALEISPEKFQEMLPKDAKAKKDISKTVKLSHAEEVAMQLGKRLKRVFKKSYTNNEDVDKNQKQNSFVFNPPKISKDKFIDTKPEEKKTNAKESNSLDIKNKFIDIENIHHLSEALAAFGINKGKLLELLSPSAKAYFDKIGKLKKKHLLEVADKLGFNYGKVDEHHEKKIGVKQIDKSHSSSIIPTKNNVKYNGKTSSLAHKKITQDDLIKYVIKVLYEHGGKAEKSDVEEAIYRMLKEIFSQKWYQDTVSHNVPRWKHNIAWAKDRARQHHGFIKSAKESGRGIWELTEAGKRHYQLNY